MKIRYTKEENNNIMLRCLGNENELEIEFRNVMEKERKGNVCKVRTQDPENYVEEVKSLVSAWRIVNHFPNPFIFLVLIP